MNLKKAVVTGLILSVVFMALECFIHGFLLQGLYNQTASVWRPEADMKRLFPLMTIGQIFFGLFAGLVFAKGYEPRRAPLGQGIRFGVYMGLMLAPMNSLTWYVILPVPQILGLYWFAASFATMMALGIVASLVYKP